MTIVLFVEQSFGGFTGRRYREVAFHISKINLRLYFLTNERHLYKRFPRSELHSAPDELQFFSEHKSAAEDQEF